jgi:hypothetical protein
MNASVKRNAAGFLFVAIMLLPQPVKKPPPPDNVPPQELTAEQISAAQDILGPIASGDVYRLAGCNPDNEKPHAPCFAIVFESQEPFRPVTTEVDLATYQLHGTHTLTCGVWIYTTLGNFAGALVQSVDASFRNQPGKVPVTLNYATRTGTRPLWGYKWSSLRGPLPRIRDGVCLHRAGRIRYWRA